ncbi:unnamed protein product [Bemisia tabaci]|uniref:Uncharacterized protein n=1 Tax=Bemisia tabaci TaxID=7038 RepID=A0A9P0F014_BEMTA|nr:unnamed protein product [Bemisia tabaci]
MGMDAPDGDGSICHPSGVRTYLNFHISPGKHRVMRRSGLTWRSRYVLTSGDGGIMRLERPINVAVPVMQLQLPPAPFRITAGDDFCRAKEKPRMSIPMLPNRRRIVPCYAAVLRKNAPENSILRHPVFPVRAMAIKLALWAFVWAAILGLVLSAPGGETGSWCYKPSREAYWGHASGTCCPGNMGSDRRCYGLRGDSGKCTKFYNCCIHQFGSGNKESDPCN